jgi:hypothetical protein
VAAVLDTEEACAVAILETATVMVSPSGRR